MNSADKQPLYVEGEKTTIKWVTFVIGDHAILEFAGIENPFKWEVTWIWNHTIYLNWTMIQLNNCVWAEKINLSIWKQKLESFNKVNFELWDVSEQIENSTQLVLELLLKHIENQIAINMDGVEKIASTLSETITDSTKAGIIRAKKIVELLTEIDKLKWLIVMINIRIEKFKAQKLANEIKWWE